MSTKKAIKSLSFLWMGSLLGSGSTFVIYMILARELGPDKFGVFSSALATSMVLSLIAGFGVSQSWLKHFGKEGWEAMRWLPSSFRLVTLSVVFVMLILFIWAFFGPHDEVTKNILLVMSLFIIGQMVVELVSVKFQLEEKYLNLAFWQLLPNISRLTIIASIVYIVSNSIDTIDIVYIYAIVALVFIIIGMYQLYNMNQNKFELKGHGEKNIKDLSIPNMGEVLSHSWAFGLASVFAFIYLQSDIIMIKYIVGDKQAGYYNIGFVILTAILIFPTVFYQKFLMPKVHRWANLDREQFYITYKKGNLAMLVSGGIIMIFIWFLSDFFVPFLFGSEYTNSITIVNILAITLPIYFTAYSVGTTLVTQEHMKTKVKLMGSVAVANIVLNLILIPKYQATGAAIATIISNLLLLVLYYSYAEKVVFIEKKQGNK